MKLQAGLRDSILVRFLPLSPFLTGKVHGDDEERKPIYFLASVMPVDNGVQQFSSELWLLSIW